jgi:hypothetical protein
MNNVLKKACVLTASIFTINANAETEGKGFFDLGFGMHKGEMQNVKLAPQLNGIELKGNSFGVKLGYAKDVNESLFYGFGGELYFGGGKGERAFRTGGVKSYSLKGGSGLNFFGMAGINIVKELSVYAKLGLGWNFYKEERSGFNNALTTVNVGTGGILYGFGTSFNVNKDYSIFAEYTILDYVDKNDAELATNVISVGFRFFF